MIELHPEFARSLLDKLSGGLAFVDRYDAVQWVNDEFATLLRSDRRRLLGRPAATLPFPLQHFTDSVERVRLVGDLILTEKILAEEPWVGRLLHIVPSHSVLLLFTNAHAPRTVAPVNAGVLSRDLGLQRLVTEISRSRRYDNPLSVCIGQVHAASLSLMTDGIDDLARLMKEQLRWVDVVVQWAADRLMMILPETTAEAAHRLQRKMVEAARTHWPVTGPQACFGTATWRRGDEALRLIRRAEAASALTSLGSVRPR